MSDSTSIRFVSRGGLKLRHALDEFGLDVRGLNCADFGANVGGFTDCLLQAGAAHVTAIDTGYGVLAWKLRQDPRVTVLERTNALHLDAAVGPFDLITIDLAWTPQRLAVPAALKHIKPTGRIITLVKPHYELAAEEKHLLHKGVLAPQEAHRIAGRTLAAMPGLGASVIASTQSPIEGGHTKGNATGNSEWLALLASPGSGF